MYENCSDATTGDLTTYEVTVDTLKGKVSLFTITHDCYVSWCRYLNWVMRVRRAGGCN
jgi:hypothetical protein